MPGHSPSMGLYYDTKSYASFLRRITALTIDLLVFSVLFVTVVLGVHALTQREEASVIIALALLFPICWLYFVELERSRFGTLGFRIASLQIVDLYGKRPGRLDMLTRLFLGWLGPFNILVDMLWIPSDPNRQALRDKFGGTYVIRKNTRPAGQGPIRYMQYFILGMDWGFREVQRKNSE